jgi:hypothetical protein
MIVLTASSNPGSHSFLPLATIVVVVHLLEKAKSREE